VPLNGLLTRCCQRLLGVCLFLMASQIQAEWRYEQQAIMGTEVSLTFWHEDSSAAKTVATAVMNEMHRIDQAFSPYKPDSELSRLNREASRAPVKVSDELYRIIDKALYYSRLTQGAFDISFASVGQHYNYREGKQPSDENRQALLVAIDYRQVKLDPRATTVYFSQPELQLDLGGIAKGYAVDRSIEILKRMGVNNATVSAGGDSRVLGDKRGRPWMVGIKNPRGQESIALTLPLADTAISTSGDYERYFIDELTGRRIHHILNPQTGQSAGELASVSVIGPQGFDTDPLSTSVFVLGVEKGIALIESIQGFDCIIIARDGKLSFSSGLGQPE